MRIGTTVSIDVDLKEVYSLCAPVNAKSCTKVNRDYVKFMLERRAEDESGNWSFPSADAIAEMLIHEGHALKMASVTNSAV